MAVAISPGIQGSGEMVFITIMAIVITLRVYRSAKGTRFSTTRLYRLPALYLIFTAIAIASIIPTSTEIMIAVASAAAGIAIGLRLAGGVKFFEKNGAVYYKRSPAIMIIWLVSFIGRFAAEAFYPSDHYALVAVALVLAVTTGLILGEAFHIKRNYEAYRKAAGIPEA